MITGRNKYVFILGVAHLLALGQIGYATGGLSENTSARLKRIKQAALEDLPKSVGYQREYILWKENKNYIGAWRQGNDIVISFKNNIDSQSITNSINRSRKVFKEDIINTKLIPQGIAWGEAIAVQNAILEASRLRIIPEVFRIGTNPRDGTLRLGVNSKDDIEIITKALQVMGIDKNLVSFDFDRLVGLGGKSGGGGAESTGSLPIRLGSLVSVPGGVCSVGSFARYNGKVGFITSQHCFTGQRLNQQVNSIRPQERIGYTTLLPQNYGGYGVDAIFVELTTSSYAPRLLQGRQRVFNSYESTTIVEAQKIYSVLNSTGVSDIIQDTVRVYGGNQGFNVLKGTWYNDTANVNGIETRLTCARISANNVTTNSGDSGSPVTDINDRIIGIFSASSKDANPDNTRLYCYVPTGEITFKLGIQLQ